MPQNALSPLQRARQALREGYVSTRRLIRKAVINNPTLDRYVGHPLRRIERLFKPYEWALDADQAGTLSVHGLSLRYRPEDKGVTTMIKLYGDYEPETRELLNDLLQPGMTFVDGGANIGYFALLGARAVGASGRVIAFEPIESTCKLLAENVRINDLSERVIIEQLALAEAPGTLKFKLEPGSSVSNKMASKEELDGPVVEIPKTSLDAYFSSQGWPQCDVVKLDIEGAEEPAFRGMRELVRRNPDLKLIFEFHMGNFDHFGTSPRAMVDTLLELGFNRFDVLYRKRLTFELPRQLDELIALARRGNVNVVATCIGSPLEQTVPSTG